MCPDVNSSLNHFLRPRGRGPAEDIPRRLRELATEAAPPYDWEEFRRRGHERQTRNDGRVRWWPHAAAAAGLAGTVAALALMGNVGSSREVPATEVAAVSSGEASGSPGTRVQVPTREWLAHQPAEPVVARVGSRLAATNLEDRIAWFDDVLMSERMRDDANPEQVQVLQQERARLVSTLAQVRYAEALMAGGS